MAKVIIFGVRENASIARVYLRHDGGHEIAAFSVHREHLPQSATFQGLPVLPFEDIESSLPPAEYRFFAPMSHYRMNRPRASIYEQVKAKGYEMISYVHSDTRVYPGTEIGENCFILENNTLQPFTAIGNNVVIWSGNHLGHHSVVEDHVFISSHVVIAGNCTVEPYCFLGINSAIREDTRLAEGSYIAMGACVTRDTEPWGVYQGNPARRRRVSSEAMKY